MAWTSMKCTTQSSTILRMFQIQWRRSNVSSCWYGGTSKLWVAIDPVPQLTVILSSQVFPDVKIGKASDVRSNTLKFLNGDGKLCVINLNLRDTIFVHKEIDLKWFSFLHIPISSSLNCAIYLFIIGLATSRRISTWHCDAIVPFATVTCSE